MDTTFTNEFKRTWFRSTIGLILHLLGTLLLAWNEGRCINSHNLLLEAYSSCVTLKAYEGPLKRHDGKIVYLKGALIVNEPLTSEDYGISIQAVKLRRRVQMFQWIEEQQPREYDEEPQWIDQTNNRHYYYVTDWKDHLINSSNFFIKHQYQNPTKMPLTSKTFLAPYVGVGNYLLSDELKAKFNDFEEIAGDVQPENKNIKLHLGIYYHSEDVFNPKTGDIRIQHYCAGQAGEQVSIIGQLQKNVLHPYLGDGDAEIAIVRQGDIDRDDLLNDEFLRTSKIDWKLRIVGVGFIYAAISCLARPLKAFARDLPALDRILSGKPGDIRNLVFTGSYSLFIMSCPWAVYHPLISFGLLIVAVIPFFFV